MYRDAVASEIVLVGVFMSLGSCAGSAHADSEQSPFAQIRLLMLWCRGTNSAPVCLPIVLSLALPSLLLSKTSCIASVVVILFCFVCFLAGGGCPP